MSITLLVLPFVLSISATFLTGGTGPSGTIHAAPTASASQDPVVFNVIVSATGFNNTSGPFTLTVNQGDVVTINFVYGDGGLSFDNPHRVFIDGYGLTTGLIDRATPTQTVTFSVGQAGQFRFHCDLPCFGMENLQAGSLAVKARCLTGSPVPTGFTPLAYQVRGSRTLSIFAFLKDMNNTPISGVIVSFYVSTDFGQMAIGQNSTYTDGLAELTYTPGQVATLPTTVNFAGTCVYGPASTAATVQLPAPGTGPGGAPYISGQALVDTRLVGVQVALAILIIGLGVAVVGSLWSTLGYVFLHAFRISKKDEKNREENNVE